LSDGSGEDFDVVLGIGEGISNDSGNVLLSLLDESDLVGSFSEELLDDGIEGGNATSGCAEVSIFVTLGACAVVEVGDEGVDVTTSLVLLALLLVLGEELEGGVSSDFVGGALLLMGVTVNLGNNDAVLSSKGISNDFVVRGKTLAVSAPLRFTCKQLQVLPSPNSSPHAILVHRTQQGHPWRNPSRFYQNWLHQEQQRWKQSSWSCSWHLWRVSCA
jgi:hypothetical protein